MPLSVDKADAQGEASRGESRRVAAKRAETVAMLQTWFWAEGFVFFVVGIWW